MNTHQACFRNHDRLDARTCSRSRGLSDDFIEAGNTRVGFGRRSLRASSIVGKQLVVVVNVVDQLLVLREVDIVGDHSSVSVVIADIDKLSTVGKAVHDLHNCVTDDVADRLVVELWIRMAIEQRRIVVVVVERIESEFGIANTDAD